MVNGEKHVVNGREKANVYRFMLHSEDFALFEALYCAVKSDSKIDEGTIVTFLINVEVVTLVNTKKREVKHNEKVAISKKRISPI